LAIERVQSNEHACIDEPDHRINMAALLRRASETGSEIWTNDNVSEVIPGIVTPLTWAVLGPLGNGAFVHFLHRVGVRRCPDTGLFGRFYGRVYLNQSQLQRLMSRFYPSHLCQMNGRRFGLWGLFRASLTLAGTGLRTLVLIPVLPRQAARLVKIIPLELELALAPGELTEQRLVSEIERWQQIDQEAMDLHLAVTIFATLLHTLLDRLVRQWSDGSVETAHLLTGLPGMKSAEMGRDLEALAAEAAADPELGDRLLTGEPSALFEHVRRLPPDHHFARQLDAFLDKHGHASFHEYELVFPRWREDLGHVLQMLQNHLRAVCEGRADLDPEDQRTTRRRTTAAMRNRLSAGPRRALFEVLLHWTQCYSVARENMKYTFVMAHSHLRELYLGLAARLVEQGALTETDDLFFLTGEEITAFLGGQTNEETLARTIFSRRAEYQTELARTKPPSIVERRPDESLHAVGEHGQILESDKTILRGIPASPGRVTGRARVILDPQISAHLEHGEILVAPSTNPAWTPLLLGASALVTDIGGLLSHAAIVAREYGLPAVLDVKVGTRVIRTGQRLVVDGYTGMVSLLDEA
jgi:phosphohistidine swiveling domain-containing protein